MSECGIDTAQEEVFSMIPGGPKGPLNEILVAIYRELSPKALRLRAVFREQC